MLQKNRRSRGTRSGNLASPSKYCFRRRENQPGAASHHLLCAPESGVQQHQLPGVGHGAGQGDVDVIGGQRHQGGEQDTGRPHPPPARLARGWTREERSMPPEHLQQVSARVSRSFTGFLYAQEPIRGGVGRKSERWRAPCWVPLHSVADAPGWRELGGLSWAKHSGLWRTHVCTARLHCTPGTPSRRIPNWKRE